jgi:hypothetical protein
MRVGLTRLSEGSARYSLRAAFTTRLGKTTPLGKVKGSETNIEPQNNEALLKTKREFDKNARKSESAIPQT